MGSGPIPRNPCPFPKIEYSSHSLDMNYPAHKTTLSWGYYHFLRQFAFCLWRMYLSQYTCFYFTMAQYFFFFFVILGSHPQHMEVPRLGVKSKLQLQAHTSATATHYPSHICDIHHSSQQLLTHWEKPGIEPVSSWILTGFINHWAMTGTPCGSLLNSFLDEAKDQHLAAHPRDLLETWDVGIVSHLFLLQHFYVFTLNN